MTANDFGLGEVGEIEQYQKALAMFNTSIPERKDIAGECRKVCADNLNVE